MKNNIASSSKRFLAFLIDFIINSSVIFVAFFYGEEVGGANGILVSIGFIISLISVKISFWYESTTLGKSFFNLVVVDAHSGDKIGFKKMFLRQTFGALASVVILNLGFIWILIDRNRQGWHDKIFNDYVISEIKASKKDDRDNDDYIHGY